MSHRGTEERTWEEAEGKTEIDEGASLLDNPPSENILGRRRQY
jgi:hypothetical protein